MPETTSCLFCKTVDERPLLRRAHPRHVVCRGCGLVFQNPRPTVGEMKEYYTQGYWEDRAVDSKGGVPSKTTGIRARAVEEFFRGKLGPQNTVLEIGCGRGNLLAHLRDALKCQVRGLEPSAREAENSRNELGIEIECGTIEQLEPMGRQYSAVVLSHVLEHVHDPRSALRCCRDTLALGGWLYVEVPNILAPSRDKRLSRWLAIEHNYYFSPNSLRRLVEEAKFRIVQQEFTHVIRYLATAIEASHDVVGEPKTAHHINEYRQVQIALFHHEIKYWPRYILKRLAHKLGLRSR